MHAVDTPRCEQVATVDGPIVIASYDWVPAVGIRHQSACGGGSLHYMRHLLKQYAVLTLNLRITLCNEQINK